MSERLSRSYPANYDAHARSVPADAYWAQVRRTIDGEPVDGAQIALIVKAITAGLSLKQGDSVVDLGCGNGALSSYLFDQCTGLLGIDISPYLIGIASEVFGRPPNYQFRVGDMISYVTGESDVHQFNKALIYAGLQYFRTPDVIAILKALHARFTSLDRVFIGNVPNRREAARVFQESAASEAELNDHKSRIGVWYFPEDFVTWAEEAGWRTSVSYMPAEFYASSYRFDVTLERRRS